MGEAVFLPAAGELQEALEGLGWAFVAEAFGDGEQEAQAPGGGVKGDAVGIVRVDPAIFGEVDDFFGERRAEGLGVGGGGGEDEFDLGVAHKACGGGPGGAFLGNGGAFFLEERVPFAVERWGFGGDWEGEGEVFEAGMTRLSAAHPDGLASERDGGSWCEFFGWGDAGLEKDVTLIALGFDGEHEHAFRLGVFEFAAFPAARQVPLDAGGDTDDARLLPVGVEARFVANEDADIKRGAGLDVSDFRDEVHGEANAVFVSLRGQREE